MKFDNACRILAFVASVLSPAASSYAAMPNPDPTLLFDDNGAELFVHPDPTITVQLIRRFTDEFFGFYFAGTPETKITLFGETDPASLDPNVAAISVIDFSAGEVRDFKTGTVRSSFTAQLEDIGYFLTAPTPLGPRTIYSQSSLNIGQLDLVGIFPTLADPSQYVMGFYAPPALGGGLLSAELIPPAPFPAIPEPETYAMMLAGLGLLGFAARRRKQKAAAAS